VNNSIFPEVHKLSFWEEFGEKAGFIWPAFVPAIPYIPRAHVVAKLARHAL
jgi:hypothetical protein